LGETCRASDYPVVSGNVSLYKETNGRAILPTPTIGGVGLLDEFTKSMTAAFKREGDAILLLGETRGWLGQSVYLRDICGREEGAPPPVDLATERRNGEFVRALIAEGAATAVHDVSDGGRLIAIVEMAIASGIRARVYAAPVMMPEHAFWFGEDQGRYVVTVRQDQADAVMARAKAAGVLLRRLGQTNGSALTLPDQPPIPVRTLNEQFEAWLPAYM